MKLRDFKKISYLTGIFSSLTEVEKFYLNDINETIAAFIPLNLGKFFWCELETQAPQQTSALENLNYECDYNRITGQNQDSIKFNFNAGYWMYVSISSKVINIARNLFSNFYPTF